MLRTSLRQSIKSMRVTSMKGCLSRGAPLVLSKRYLQTFSSPVLGSAMRAQVSRNMFSNNLTFRSSFQLKFTRGEATIIKVPEMAESITEGTLASFTKKVGDYIGQDELLATIETDKIDVEVNSPVGGTVRELLANPDDDVEVGQDLAKIEPGPPPAGGAKPAETEPSKPDEEAPKAEAATEKPAPKPKAASIPAAAAVAASAPKPTSVPSPSSSNSEPAPAAKSSVPPPTAPRVVSPYGQFSRSEERIKMNRMRRRIAERLKTAQNTAASLTTFNEVDMTSIMEMRKLYKDEFLKKTGIKMGFMGPFSKACTLAAKDFPSVGAAIENDDTLVYRDYMDISVAVATPKGLVTPVVRNAESLSILDIEAEISNLAKKARDGKLSLEDLAGGTFTISNGGIFGSLYGTPIINSPQTAVLGLHGIKQRPVTVNGKIESRPMMYLALTYDHRVLDGREAVSFLRTVKELIEDPRKMLLM